MRSKHISIWNLSSQIATKYYFKISYFSIVNKSVNEHKRNRWYSFRVSWLTEFKSNRGDAIFWPTGITYYSFHSFRWKMCNWIGLAKHFVCSNCGSHSNRIFPYFYTASNCACFCLQFSLQNNIFLNVFHSIPLIVKFNCVTCLCCSFETIQFNCSFI